MFKSLKKYYWSPGLKAGENIRFRTAHNILNGNQYIMTIPESTQIYYSIIPKRSTDTAGMKSRNIIDVLEIGNPHAKGIVVKYNKHTIFNHLANKYFGYTHAGEVLVFIANRSELSMNDLVNDVPVHYQIYYSYFKKPVGKYSEKVECKKRLCDAFGLPQSTKMTVKDYRKWAIKNHPDKGGDTVLFQEIQNCWTYYEDEVKENRVQAC
jgi:hypothetical protein